MSLPNIFRGNFFQSIFTQTDNYVPSTACDSLHLDVVTGTALCYSMMEASIAIPMLAVVLSLSSSWMMRSLGKFVNVVLKQPRVNVQLAPQRMPNFVLG